MWDSHPTPCLRQETNLDEMGFLVVPRISLVSQSVNYYYYYYYYYYSF